MQKRHTRENKSDLDHLSQTLRFGHQIIYHTKSLNVCISHKNLFYTFSQVHHSLKWYTFVYRTTSVQMFSVDSVFLIVSLLLKEGKYQEALGKWEAALNLVPENAVLHEQKAQVLLELGDAWKALKAATRNAQSLYILLLLSMYNLELDDYSPRTLLTVPIIIFIHHRSY